MSEATGAGQAALMSHVRGPGKKFIRARFWGVISGEPRLSQLHEETDWVDVKNPFSEEIIVSFHRKETGEWAPHVMSDPPPLAVPSLDTSVRKGQTLIDGLTAFKAQIEQDLKKSQAGHRPVWQ
nr:hypothetical protein GCM10020185_34530 [Pseudomonas brassicacearum subsp. brassicacearum]